MGLENLKSVFNDLSENVVSEAEINGFSNIRDNTTHQDASRNPHTHYEGYGGRSNQGIHGGLTNERPSTPPHSEEHSLLDFLPNVPLLGPDNQSMSPTLESRGTHGDLIIKKSGQKEVDKPHPDNHSQLDDLKKIGFDAARTFPSNLTQETPIIEFNSYYDAERIGPQSGYSGKVTAEQNNSSQISLNPIDERKKLRTGDEFLKLGINNRLGQGDLILETLYNVNHSAVIDRKDIVIRASSENWWDSTPNGNAGTIYINRAGMGDKTLLDINRYRSGKLKNFRGFDRGDEPYIVQPIGSDRYATLTNRDTLPLHRALDDTSRLFKFYESEAGKQSIFNENVTNMLIGNSIQPFRTDTILKRPFANPIQGNTGFLNVTNDYFQDLGGIVGSLRKPLTVEYSAGLGNGIYFFKNLGDRTAGIEQLQNLKVSTDQPTFVQKGLQKLKEGVIKKLANVAQLPVLRKTPFIDLSGEGRHTDFGRGYTDKVNSQIPTPDDKSDLLDIKPFVKGDFYVKIKDLRKGGKFLYFRGFVTGIVENVSPTWTPTNYIGRSEPVYMYERAERDLSFNLRVYPNNELEFNAMYEKIDYLTSLAYPNYQHEFKKVGIGDVAKLVEDKDSQIRMQPPFTELYMAHIGSRKKGQFGFIKSLSYTVNDSGDWDALSARPRLFDIAISYQILNRKPPQMGDEFYRASV